AQCLGMALVVEQNIALDPGHIGLFCAQRIMLAAQDRADSIQEAGGVGGHGAGLLGQWVRCDRQVRCPAALGSACQPVYTCSTRRIVVRLLHRVGGKAGYASAETLLWGGWDGRL